MPHDRSGREINVGDVVLVACVVTSLASGDEYCNAQLETVEPMFPGDYKSVITLNTKQVLLPSDESEPPVHRPPGAADAGTF